MPDKSKTLASWVLEENGSITFTYADGSSDNKWSEHEKWSEKDVGVVCYPDESTPGATPA
jgi:hypothetical protein